MAVVFRDLPEKVKKGLINILTRIDNLTINYTPDERIVSSEKNGASSNDNHIPFDTILQSSTSCRDVNENSTNTIFLVASSTEEIISCSPAEIEIYTNTSAIPETFLVECEESENVPHIVTETEGKQSTSRRIFESKECSIQIHEETSIRVASTAVDKYNVLERTEGDENCQLPSSTTKEELERENPESPPSLSNDPSDGQKPMSRKRPLHDKNKESTRSDSVPSIKRHRSSVQDPDDSSSED